MRVDCGRLLAFAISLVLAIIHEIVCFTAEETETQ